MTRYDGISEVLFDYSTHDVSIYFSLGVRSRRTIFYFRQQRRRAVRLDVWDNDTEGKIFVVSFLGFFSLLYFV